MSPALSPQPGHRTGNLSCGGVARRYPLLPTGKQCRSGYLPQTRFAPMDMAMVTGTLRDLSGLLGFQMGSTQQPKLCKRMGAWSSPREMLSSLGALRNPVSRNKKCLSKIKFLKDQGCVLVLGQFMSQWILLWLNPQPLSSAMCKEVRAKCVADLSLPPGRDQTFIILCGAPIGNMHPPHSLDRAVVVIYVTLQDAEPALQPAAPHPFASSVLPQQIHTCAR